MQMTVLLDNKGQGKVGEALSKSIQADARLSVISSLFSVYGYSLLKLQLDQIEALRLLVPAGNVKAGLADSHQSFPLAGVVGDEGDKRFRNTLNLTAVARECAAWLEQKAEIKAVSLPVLQNLFHIDNTDGDTVAIYGSSSFTTAGLGFTPARGYEMNTLFNTPAETASLLNWFDSIWTNPEVAQDIKSLALAQLKEIFATKSPEQLYFLTLYHIFREFLGELDEVSR